MLSDASSTKDPSQGLGIIARVMHELSDATGANFKDTVTSLPQSRGKTYESITRAEAEANAKAANTGAEALASTSAGQVADQVTDAAGKALPGQALAKDMKAQRQIAKDAQGKLVAEAPAPTVTPTQTMTTIDGAMKKISDGFAKIAESFGGGSKGMSIKADNVSIDASNGTVSGVLIEKTTGALQNHADKSEQGHQPAPSSNAMPPSFKSPRPPGAREM
jgi:hypothetical protein